MTPSMPIRQTQFRVKVKWVAASKGTVCEGLWPVSVRYLYCYYKGNGINLQRKKLSQLTPVSEQTHASTQAFIWLARRKLLQVWLESKKQVRKILSHSSRHCRVLCTKQEKSLEFLQRALKGMLTGSVGSFPHHPEVSVLSPVQRWGHWATDGSCPVWGSKPVLTVTCSVCEGEKCETCGQWSMMVQIS